MKEELKAKLKRLRREEAEIEPAASVAEAIDLLILCCDYLLDLHQPERSKREDRCIKGGYFPPPWKISEYPEKTEGWIAFQEAQRKNPKYYGCGALNSMET